MAQRGHVRVPAVHRAEGEGRARTVAGGHVADPVCGREGNLLLAGAAALPERRLHRDPPAGRVALPYPPASRRSKTIVCSRLCPLDSSFVRETCVTGTRWRVLL